MRLVHAVAAAASAFVACSASAAVVQVQADITPLDRPFDIFGSANLPVGVSFQTGDTVEITLNFANPIDLTGRRLPYDLTFFVANGFNGVSSLASATYELINATGTLPASGEAYGTYFNGDVTTNLLSIASKLIVLGPRYDLLSGSFQGIRMTYQITGLGGSFNRFGFSAATNVTEPATWALMLAGLGAVGGAVRHRRTTALPA